MAPVFYFDYFSTKRGMKIETLSADSADSADSVKSQISVFVFFIIVICEICGCSFSYEPRTTHGNYENQHVNNETDRNPNQVSLSAHVLIKINQAKNAERDPN